MNLSDRHGLSHETISALKKIFSQHPSIEKVVLYGSRAKGTYKHGSDIDLTIFSSPKLTTQDLLRIENEIEELMLPYKIDLSLFHQIENPDLIDHIQHIGQIFYLRGPT
ncbi:MAG: nucleotidyltransferase domain-containing protein [Bdellovibrionaceae bacterium]|nr:nucleotidyltransferase domain-containing protein [Pseudobdellovibrionaceae bacterium]